MQEKLNRKIIRRLLTQSLAGYEGEADLLPWNTFFHLGIFPIVFVYYEILLRLFGSEDAFANLWYPVLFGLSAGFLMNVLSIWKSQKWNRIISTVIMGAVGILYITECLVQKTFQMYMPFSAIVSGADGVMGNYNTELVNTLTGSFFVIVMFMLPMILYIWKGKKYVPAHQYRWPVAAVTVLAAVVLWMAGEALIYPCDDVGKYTTQFDFDTGTETFGLAMSIRLGYENSDEAELVVEEPVVQETSEEVTAESEEPKEIVYEPNVMELDLDRLIKKDDETYQAIDKYVDSLTPSDQNEYTGIFEGKNLILICAEAFSGAVVSKELTPTLYRMVNNGFRFSDYYQCTWGGSTITGEYSFLTGLVPTYATDTILNTVGKNEYFTLPNQMQRLGYVTAGYHNGDYNYYDRDQTHTNLGFNTWIGDGNGLEELTGKYPTDSQMFEETIDQYVDGEPFCLYYMTVSGHSPYDINNELVLEYKDEVTEIIGEEYSDTTIAYYCYQYELEKAMEVLVQKLEKAEIADDTVICLTADHYPYGLSAGAYNNAEDYYEEVLGQEIETSLDQDQNSLIIWSECLEKGGELEEYQCEIKEPTYSLDIVPTLSNLFGLEFDSRLLVGRDVFSDTEAMVVWNTYSWLTEKGYYNSSTGEFTAYEKDVSQKYIDRMCAIAQNKVNFSIQVIDNDYYGHLFGEDSVTDTTVETDSSDDNKDKTEKEKDK